MEAKVGTRDPNYPLCGLLCVLLELVLQCADKVVLHKTLWDMDQAEVTIWIKCATNPDLRVIPRAIKVI